MYLGTAQIEASPSDLSSAEGWSKALDRVDVFSSKDGYTATILRHDEVGEPQLISMRNGRPRTWRDLDNLVAFVLRNVTNHPSIQVHIGAKQ